MTQSNRLPSSRRTAGTDWRRFPPVAVAACVAVALALLTGIPAFADEHFDRGSKDKFLMSVGTYLINFDTKASLDSATLGGTDVNFENDLGLTSNQTRLRLEGYWRFARKHRLDFGGYFYTRKADRLIDQQIQWGDVLYDVGAEIHSEINTRFYKLDYKYSFVRTQKLEFAASAGLSTLQTRAELAGQGTVSGGGSATFQKETKSLLAPIPVFGVHGEWCMVDHLFLRGGAEYLAVNVAGWQGRVGDFRLSLDWYPLKHFGFGAGYNTFYIDAKNSGDLSLDFRYGFSGLLGYATYVY